VTSRLEYQQDIDSLSLDKAELKTLITRIQERLYEASLIECEAYRPANLDPEQIENDREIIKDGFRLFISLKGDGGICLNGSVDEIFENPNFPEQVESVFFNSTVPLKSKQNFHVSNSILLFLDFSKPKVFDFSIMPSHATANPSKLQVDGDNHTWCNGVFAECMKFISSHKGPGSLIHKSSIYDAILWIVGIPFGLHTVYNISKSYNWNTLHPFYGATLYLYSFLLCLTCFRILFHYARWVFPKIEYRGTRSQPIIHRAALATIVLGIASSIILDLAKYIFR
jgi:hypothetical protein